MTEWPGPSGKKSKKRSSKSGRSSKKAKLHLRGNPVLPFTQEIIDASPSPSQVGKSESRQKLFLERFTKHYDFPKPKEHIFFYIVERLKIDGKGFGLMNGNTLFPVPKTSSMEEKKLVCYMSWKGKHKRQAVIYGFATTFELEDRITIPHKKLAKKPQKVVSFFTARSRKKPSDPELLYAEIKSYKIKQTEHEKTILPPSRGGIDDLQDANVKLPEIPERTSPVTYIEISDEADMSSEAQNSELSDDPFSVSSFGPVGDIKVKKEKTTLY